MLTGGRVLGGVRRAVQAGRRREREHSTNFSGGSGASAWSIPMPMTAGRPSCDDLLTISIASRPCPDGTRWR